MPNPPRPFPEASRARSVFLSYSHKDEVWKDRLNTHLGVLGIQGLLDPWDDRRIGAGTDWFEEIQEAMARTDAAILLISAEFLSSEFINGQEVPKLLERRAKEGLPVIPVMVRACNWKRVPWLAKLQARPNDDKTLASLEGEGGDRCDAALASITEEILTLLEKKTQTRDSFSDLESRGRLDDFLDRVAAVCRLREPEAEIQRYPGIGDAGGYLRVLRRIGAIRDMYPVGAVEHGLSRESFQSFLTEIDAPYRKSDQGLISYLVYGGAPAPADLVAEAGSRRVHLVSFVEYQGLIDFRSYLGRQTVKLAEDPIYPPHLYVSQRMRTLSILGREEDETIDALAQVREWLDSPHGRFLVLLGDFGTGKTFLLHEIARRIGETEGGLIPILLQMRSLEKGRSLDALLAQHFAQEGMEGFSPARFRYMLDQGRVALLFDGFDELALRVTYSKAADHFSTLLQAATGHAKVVLTSRRQHFLSESQVKTALAERVEALSGHRLAILQHFDREQVRLFLVNFFEGEESKAEARLGLIDRVKDLLGLSANPRLLGFIAELPEDQLVAASKGGEITAAKLYELLLTRWLEYEFDRVHPKGAPPGLSVAERWHAVTLLAMRLWQKTDRFVSLTDLSEEAARVVQVVGPAAPDAEVAAFQVGSGTLLVRDDEGNFAFLHQSILEWLVAKSAAEALAAEESPDVLTAREISPLMADFLADLAGREQAITWARNVLAAPAGEGAKKNAFLVLERQKEEIREKLDLSGQNLRGQDYSGQDLSGADLSGADLTEARLVGTRLEAALLAKATLRDADLSAAILTGADLTEADLTGARLLGTDLRGARLTGASLRRAKLLGTALNSEGLEDAERLGAALHVDKMRVQGRSMWECPTVTWSPDGELLATASSEGIRLWEARSRLEIRLMRKDQPPIVRLVFSPDGINLASSSGSSLELWEVSSGGLIRTYTGFQGVISSLALSPNGKTLAIGSHNIIHLRQVNSHREIHTLTGHKGTVLSLAFSPDGSTLASGSQDQTVRLWQIESGREIRILSGHKDEILSVAFSTDGKILASGSTDETVRLWRVDDGHELRILNGHPRGVGSIAFSPSGRVFASSDLNQTIHLWHIEDWRKIRSLNGHLGGISSIAFSPNGDSLASAGGEPIARIWQVESGKQIGTLHGRQSGVWSVAFSPNGKTLCSSSYDEIVRLWQVDSGRCIRAQRGHQGWIRSVAFSPDGKILASGSDDMTIRLWEVENGQEMRTLSGPTGGFLSIAFSPDGKTLASGSGSALIHIWQVNSGRELRSWSVEASWIWSIAFSPDSKILASGADGAGIHLWHADSGRALRALVGHEQMVFCVAFSPDGDTLASGSYDQTVRLWQVDRGREICVFRGHQDQVSSVAFHPNGKILASGSHDRTVRLWRADEGCEIRTLSAHQDLVKSVAFSPDGNILASGSLDGTIRLWNVADGQCLAILLPLPEGWVAYSPDGRYKFGGVPAGGFWHAANLCRFEIGELDEWVPGLRLADDASFFDLPPWKPEIRVPERIAKARQGAPD